MSAIFTEHFDEGSHTPNEKGICTVCEGDYNIEVETQAVILMYSTLELYTKGVYTVSAKVMPSEVKGEVLTWTSSNSGIATIDNQGNITPLKNGKVTITVTASNGKSASQDFMVREVLGEVTIYIGDVIGWPGKDYASYDFSVVEGNEETVDLSSSKVIMGKKVGSVVISSYDSEYLRVRVNKQDKLTINQVIALTGYPPTSVNGKELDYTLFTTGGGREYLRTHFRNYVLPKLDGMSLDITLPSWEFSEGEERLFQEWLLMMYGELKPTPEEMMALLAYAVEPIPIIGTAVTIRRTIVSFQNGETIQGLINSGVVFYKVTQDIILVRSAWQAAVEFSFTDDARGILTTSAVGQIDEAVRMSLLNQLDDYERLVRGTIDDELTSTIWDRIIGTAETIPDTKILTTFQIKLDDAINYVNPQTKTNVVWTNTNATKHMGEYISRFGGKTASSGVRSQIMLESYQASLNEAMQNFLSLPKGRHFGTFGNWELGINTETGVVFHALMN